MKKSILAVAGVAALAGVAVPFAGVNAADNVALTDTVSVTIGDNCSFTSTPGTFTKTDMTISALTDFSGASSSYKVICNNSKGYAVTATFNAMTSTDTTDTIPYYTSTAPVIGTAVWGAYQDSSSTPIASGATTLNESKATSATGDTFTMKYKVSTDAVQEQGTYTGTATYTFAQKSAS